MYKRILSAGIKNAEGCIIRRIDECPVRIIA